MSPLLVLLLVYSVGLIVLGAWVGRAVRRSADFFVAGRSLGIGLLGSTFLAANIGAGSTLGATGYAYTHGLAAWWWNGSAGLGSLVLAFWVGPRLWRSAQQHGFLTVGDFLEHAFGRPVRTLAATFIWLVLAMSVNWALDTNYGYFNSKPDGTVLDYLGPWPLYVLAEMAIVLSVWALITWPWVKRRAG